MRRDRHLAPPLHEGAALYASAIDRLIDLHWGRARGTQLSGRLGQTPLELFALQRQKTADLLVDVGLRNEDPAVAQGRRLLAGFRLLAC